MEKYKEIDNSLIEEVIKVATTPVSPIILLSIPILSK